MDDKQQVTAEGVLVFLVESGMSEMSIASLKGGVDDGTTLLVCGRPLWGRAFLLQS
jgi:hypothetical protein